MAHAPEPSGAEADRDDPPIGIQERREKLAGLIATKLQQGYWVESQRDTDAVLASLGPHRWFGRVGPREENGREAVSVDAQGHTTVVRLPRRRY